MPEHLRALVFILVLATVVFAFARVPASALAMADKDFDRRCKLWFALTLIAFLAHNFWLYVAVAGILLVHARRSERNGLALYFFVLFAVPPIPGEISGMGLIAALFQMDYVRLLGLTVLLPAFFYLRKQAGTDPFGRLLADKLLAGYLMLSVLLMFEHRTFTSILRDGFFYAFVDIFLPYYVASRALRNLADFRDALMSFAVAAMVLSATLFLEFSRHWLLYQALERALGAPWGWNSYLVRGDNIRATGTIGHAIAAGYVVAVALGFYLYLRKVVPNATLWRLGFALLIAGLIGPLSRAPWVGAVLMVVVFVATGPAPALKLAKLGLIGMVAVPVLLLTPYGATIIDHLPFVGTIDERNVIGRQLLAEMSYQVFWENPLLGTHDFVLHPALQTLRGDDGQVDLVNTYAVVVLGRGLVGLVLFVGFFLAVIFVVWKGMRDLADRNDEHHVLGRALLAVLLGILFIIATVSPVLRIPTIYWIVAGLGVAYSRMLVRAKAPVAATGTASRPAPSRLAGAHGALARTHDER